LEKKKTGVTLTRIRNCCFRQLKRRLEPHESLACGGAAGGLSVFLSHPVDTVKSNMQSLGAAGKYRGNFDCARQVQMLRCTQFTGPTCPLMFYRGLPRYEV
jgi:hypothetical protein